MHWRQIILAISLCLNGVLFYGLIWGQVGAFAYKDLKNECVALEKKIKNLDDSNIALSKEIQLLQTDERYLEKMIRMKLNFVRDNEILYMFPDEADSDASGALPNEAKN